MNRIELPVLEKYGKEIGKAADAGDEDAKKIIYWYSTSRRIRDYGGIGIAESLAKDWVNRQALEGNGDE